MPTDITLKLLLAGDSGVGKTALISSLFTGEFEPQHVPTVATSKTTLRFWTNNSSGPICFSCLEITGDEAFQGAREVYFAQGDCAILMFDVTSRASFRNVKSWYEAIVRVCGRIPIVLCGNKVDVTGRQTHTAQINFDRTIRLPYFELSAKSDTDTQLSKPFESLAKTLLRDDRIVFVDAPAIMCFLPPAISAEQVAQLQADYAAAILPLPDDDEDL